MSQALPCETGVRQRSGSEPGELQAAARSPARFGSGPRIRILVAFAPLLLLAATCQRTEVVGVLPDDLHGRWRTNAQSHADAFLDLSEDEIGFGREGIRAQAFRIHRIEADRVRSEHVPLYTIEYITVDGNRFFSFWYQERYGVIRLNHRWDMMWRREGDGSEPSTGGEAREAARSSPPDSRATPSPKAAGVSG